MFKEISAKYSCLYNTVSLSHKYGVLWKEQLLQFLTETIAQTLLFEANTILQYAAELFFYIITQIIKKLYTQHWSI